MALNADEKKLLEELNARASAPDEDDDYEIEVYDTAANKGARIPYRTGRDWLHQTFGIGSAPAPAEGTGADDETPPADAKPAARAYFGGKK